MVSPKPKTKLTYEDYAKTPDDERWELIDGELFRMPSPNVAHQITSGRLFLRMAPFVDERDLGIVLDAPMDVVMSDTDTVEPDLLFISKERMGIIARLNIQGAPDLVVEIHSPSTAQRDLTAKRELYARHGVKEYWPIDPDTRTVRVLLLDDGDFVEVGVYKEGDTVTSPTLEGFSFRVEEIFPALGSTEGRL